MTRYVGYIAMSLDGRIADGDGEIGWLLDYGMPDEAKADYDAFYAGIDALVMGRATYDWIVANHEWSYGGRISYVVTRRPLEAERDDIVAVPPDYPELKARLEAAGHRNVWILGGGVAQRAALEAGMFDHIRVFVIPVIVGSGPLLFADGPLHRLELTGSRVWPGGAVEIAYALRHEP
ncbi:MAG: dihydrofolate reductase [Alphaproteobacteria bacterium]|nr:MAG: dihydrofolate reductase [Alphaproteobacteria bacterium]